MKPGQQEGQTEEQVEEKVFEASDEGGELLDAESGAAALQNWLNVKTLVPKRGLKRQMTQMAIENARVALDEKFRLIERDEERTSRAAENLGVALGLTEP